APCTDDGQVCTRDVCSGSGATCQHPAGNAGATCRAAAGPCDVAEVCDGVATSCPSDTFAPSTQVCRPSAGECDVAETCTGSGAVFPVDAFCPLAAPCTDDGQVCTRDVCSGTAAACQHLAGNAGLTCRAAAGPCDVA